MYQYVLVCTMNRLNLSSFEIQLRHIVSHAKELYSLYLISSDSVWMSQETTCLLGCTYWYVPVHTCTYDREILVLPCTMLYQYVLVRTSMYRFAQSCPGVQDSRCTYRFVLSTYRYELGTYNRSRFQMDILKQRQSFLSIRWLSASSCSDSGSLTMETAIFVKSHLKK
jgi:hypothetical protein